MQTIHIHLTLNIHPDGRVTVNSNADYLDPSTPPVVPLPSAGGSAAVAPDAIAPAPSAAPPPPADDSITDEQLRAALVAAVRRVGKDVLNFLPKIAGVERISDVPEDKKAELLDALNAAQREDVGDDIPF